MYPKICFAFLFATSAATAVPTEAVNPAFMPGDAFFHSELTGKSLKRFGRSGIELEYTYPPDTFAFCGYAGFRELRILGDTSALSRHVRALFKARIRQQSGKKYVHAMGGEDAFNRFHLFVYNRKATWDQRLRIGLKYNENWHRIPKSGRESDSRKTGFARSEAARFTTFVPTAASVAHEWQYAEEIPGLAVEVPEGTGWGVSGPPIDKPARIDAEAVQLVILPEPDVRVLFAKDPSTEFFTVTVEGTLRWWWNDKGAAQSEPWQPGSD